MAELCGLALGHFANEILQHLDALGPVADQIRFMTKFLLWTVLPFFLVLIKIQIASLYAPLSCNPCSPSSVEEAIAVDTQRTRHTTLLLGPVLASVVRYGSIKVGKKGLLHSVLLHLLSGL